MFKTLSAPISVQWELTPWCNHRCVHCYNYWRNETGDTQKQPENAQHITKSAADELVANKVFHVTLTGGEPLAALKASFSQIVQIRDAGIDLSINSNLALLSDEILDMLLRLGIRSVLTSLMASEAKLNDELAGHAGAYSKTINGIERAVNAGLKVIINTVVTKRNAMHVKMLGMLAKQVGATTFCATKASKPNACRDFSDFHLSKEELERMFDDLLWVRDNGDIQIDSLEHYPACAFPNSEARTAFSSRNCSAGKSGCTIGFDGQIRPCSHAHIQYGSILNGLGKGWQAMEDWRCGTFVPTFCKLSCPEYPLRCGGGCRIEACSSAGSLGAADPFFREERLPYPKTNAASSQVLKDNAYYVASSKLRFRQESFGYIVYRDSRHWFAIDEILYGFLCRGSTPRPFSAADLATAYGVDKKTSDQTLRLLVSKKMVNEGAKE